MLRIPTLIGILSAAAPAQWITNPLTGNEYQLTAPMTWQQAQSYADSLGAHLAIVNDADENAWIANHFLFVSSLYLGGTDESNEGQWNNPYGWPLGYQNWAPNQPDNYQGNEDYLTMWPANGPNAPHASWNDGNGLTLLPAVIERPIPQAIAYGSGCNGSNGAPVLALAPASAPPAPGNTVVTTTSNLPQVSGLALGFAAMEQLIVPLTVLGMPGCASAINPNGAVWTLLPHNGNTVSWQFQLPNLPVLRGMQIYEQVMVFDLNANAFGATTSNGLELRLGY